MLKAFISSSYMKQYTHPVHVPLMTTCSILSLQYMSIDLLAVDVTHGQYMTQGLFRSETTK